MEVDLTITFKQKDLEEMCLERCKGIATATPGHFEAHASGSYYAPAIVVDFVEDKQIEPKPPKKDAEAEPVIPGNEGLDPSLPADADAVSPGIEPEF